MRSDHEETANAPHTARTSTLVPLELPANKSSMVCERVPTVCELLFELPNDYPSNSPLEASVVQFGSFVDSGCWSSEDEVDHMQRAAVNSVIEGALAQHKGCESVFAVVQAVAEHLGDQLRRVFPARSLASTVPTTRRSRRARSSGSVGNNTGSNCITDGEEKSVCTMDATAQMGALVAIAPACTPTSVTTGCVGTVDDGGSDTDDEGCDEEEPTGDTVIAAFLAEAASRSRQQQSGGHGGADCGGAVGGNGETGNLVAGDRSTRPAILHHADEATSAVAMPLELLELIFRKLDWNTLLRVGGTTSPGLPLFCVILVCFVL
jgi:hypothetical protein